LHVKWQAHMRISPVREASALGQTAWNAYAYNVSYRTGEGHSCMYPGPAQWCRCRAALHAVLQFHQMQRVLSCGPVVIGPHTDGKNVAGSYSALMVCEVGDPVAGGFYMLPQYHAALDIRQGAQWQRLPCCWSPVQSSQSKRAKSKGWRASLIAHHDGALAAGVVMFHRSGDAEVGLHGNSGMWCASLPCCHFVHCLEHVRHLVLRSCGLVGSCRQLPSLMVAL
jgi:hypothetical protein